MAHILLVMTKWISSRFRRRFRAVGHQVTSLTRGKRPRRWPFNIRQTSDPRLEAAGHHGRDVLRSFAWTLGRQSCRLVDLSPSGLRDEDFRPTPLKVFGAMSAGRRLSRLRARALHT